MRRHRRLRSYTPLQRRAPLKIVPLTGRPDQLTRMTVLERDGFCCIGCGRGGWPLHLHHRVPLGQGGSRDPAAHSPVNLLSICLVCHDGIHGSPAQARLLGHLVRRGVDPAVIPVFTVLRGLVLLTADGWFVHVADVEVGASETRKGWY